MEEIALWSPVDSAAIPGHVVVRMRDIGLDLDVQSVQPACLHHVVRREQTHGGTLRVLLGPQEVLPERRVNSSASDQSVAVERKLQISRWLKVEHGEKVPARE